MMDDGTTARNSPENRFPACLEVTSRCSGFVECRQTFVPEEHFEILETVKFARG
jgi:hypothetical protein